MSRLRHGGAAEGKPLYKYPQKSSSIYDREAQRMGKPLYKYPHEVVFDKEAHNNRILLIIDAAIPRKDRF